MALHQPSGRWRLGFGLSLLTVLMWGVLPIVLKIMLRETDAFTITWFRFTVAALCLAPYLAARRGLPTLRNQKRRVHVLLALAVLGLVSNYILFILGLDHIPAGTSQVLIQFAPAFAMLGFLVFFRERFSTVQWVGFIVLSSGMLLFFHNKLGEIFLRFGEYSLGVVLILLAAITWAIYALAQKQLLTVMSSGSILLIIYFCSVLILSPSATPLKVLELDALHFWLLVFCGLNTVIAYGAFSEALDHWEASRVSAVVSLTPMATLIMVQIGSALLPTLVAPEELTITASVGAVLVVIGSMMVALGHNPRQNHS